jgi:hypothetical protein
MATSNSFVQLVNTGNDTIHVNPRHIVSVLRATGSAITLVTTVNGELRVKETPQDVLSKLAAAR